MASINLNAVRSNPDSIVIVDDPFPDWVHKTIESQSRMVPWTLRQNLVFGNEEVLFTYISYVDGENLLDHLHSNIFFSNAFSGVINQCSPREQDSTLRVQGIRWNCLIKGFDANLHHDHPDDSCVTCVYFVNDGDGDLVFYENDQTTEIKRCEFKKGRAVIFPSTIFHRAFAPTQHSFRITLAAQYFKD